jgi:hypothetical protein
MKHIIIAAILITIFIFISIVTLWRRREAFDLYYDSMAGWPLMVKLPKINYALKHEISGIAGYCVLGELVLSWGRVDNPIVMFNRDMSVPFKEPGPFGVLVCPGFMQGQTTKEERRVLTTTSSNMGVWGFTVENMSILERPLYYLAWGALDPSKHYHDIETPPEIRTNMMKDRARLKQLL